MGLKIQVIVTDITNLSDARYCAGMGVDYIGFRIDEGHEKYVDLQNFKEITDWVAGVGIACETSNIPQATQQAYQADCYIFNNVNLLPEYTGNPAFWRIDAKDMTLAKSLLVTHKAKIAGIIIDSTTDEGLKPYDQEIRSIADDFDIFLGFGVSIENVGTVLEELPAKGLSLSGDDEIRPGYKDYELADLLELLEEDN